MGYTITFVSVGEKTTVRRTYKPGGRTSLDPYDACDLARDGHGARTMSSRNLTRATDTSAYYGDVLLGRVGASLGVVQRLLRLAILVHRDRHHLLLSRQ